jgi:hypothetical protein
MATWLKGLKGISMSREKIDRHAVPEDRIERFMGFVYSMAETCGINDIPEVFHYVELLGQSVERHLAESKLSGPTVNRSESDRRQFIATFKNRYLILTDREYDRAINAVDCKMINNLTKLLEECGVRVDEFMAWFFDDFLNNNPKFCPPNLKFTCGHLVSEKFMFDNKDMIKQRKEEKIRKKLALDVTNRARVIVRVCDKDENIIKNIKEILQNYKDGRIMLDRFRQEIEAIEKMLRDRGVNMSSDVLGG